MPDIGSLPFRGHTRLQPKQIVGMLRPREPIIMRELGSSFHGKPSVFGGNKLPLHPDDILSNFVGAAYVVFRGSQMQTCGIRLSANDSFKLAQNPSLAFGTDEPANIRAYDIYLAEGGSCQISRNGLNQSIGRDGWKYLTILEPGRYCLHFLPGPGQRNRDIGLFASWSVSSSKPGFEVEQLTDPSTTTFWQSEGPQPHHINIIFPRRMAIAQLSIFVDIGLDDSYTPQKLSIRAGTFHGDLQEIEFVELDNPRGWVHPPLGSLAEAGEGNTDDLDYSDPEAHAIRANILQLAILGNHLNGKDTHVRHVRIFGPKR